VECVEDVIEELAPQLAGVRAVPAAGVVAKTEAAAAKSTEEARSTGSNEVMMILNQLKAGQKTHIDSLIETSGLNVQTVLKLLLELELRGQVTQHPGKLFSLA
jgi:predicted Rossmann fold nucleotide-binding protein DprA/Smf involved in DNA uptake